ncbi:MAG: hypothetical protein ACK56I_24165, partial [bacterium]
MRIGDPTTQLPIQNYLEGEQRPASSSIMKNFHALFPILTNRPINFTSFLLSFHPFSIYLS